MKVRISLEAGETPTQDGVNEIWIWKDGSELNQKWVSNKPLYDIFNAEEVYILCGLFDEIIVPFEKITNNFERLI